jgi:hypothetical protein
MKTRIITTVAVAGLLAALAAGDVFAAGRGNGGASQGVSTATGSNATVRPAGSQRRDGTFLTAGTTANGSTTRNGSGTGLLNGTCVTPAPAPTVAPAQ